MSDTKVEQKAVVKSVATTVLELVERYRPQLAALVPKHVSVERLERVLYSTIAKSAKLQQCSAASLVEAFRKCAEVGLEPGGALGHAYIVPYKGEATAIYGYKGLLELMRRSGLFDTARAVIVHAKDRFRYLEGMSQTIDHEPCLDQDPGPMTRVYCVIKYTSGSLVAEVMSREQVDVIRSRAPGRDHEAWTLHYDEMAKKTCLRRVAKWGPMSSEVAEAIERDDDVVVDGEARVVAVEPVAGATATERAAAAVTRRLSEVMVENSQLEEKQS